MTIICGGGTSGPNIGLDIAATYGAGRLAQLLVDAGLSELSAWLPAVGIIPLAYGLFCASDPPAMVALTQAESDALANNTFGPDFANGLGKFKDVLLNLIWLDTCHCTSGALSVPTVPAVNPNTPVFVTPIAPPTAPCLSLAFPQTTITGTNGLVRESQNKTGWNVTAVDVTVDTAITAGAGCGTNWSLTHYGPGPTPPVLRVDTFTLGAAAHFHLVYGCPIGTETVFLTVVGNGAPGTSSINERVAFYCNGTIPGGVQQPCCPPDVTTQAYLDIILRTVQLIQRQNVPFGLVEGTVHAGLTGAGHINVSGLIGLKCSIDSSLDGLPHFGSSPTYYEHLGYVTMGTDGAFPHSVRLGRASQLIMPARASVYTDVDYDLYPGVIATITELLREP